jgi:CheY-like chemotaxis protein
MQLDILNASILIVDDQAANVQLLEQLLSEAGYTNLSATMNPMDVCALHDIQMPGMDGFQVMERLKANDADSYLPVIVLTAQPVHKLNALKAGAKDFISKPFDLLEVKTRIHNMLEVRLLYKKLAEYNQELEDTVRTRTEELRASESRFRRLTELASDWYWEQDEYGHFVNMPDSLLKLLGICSAEQPQQPDTLTDWNENDRTQLYALLASRQPFVDFTCCRTNNKGQTQYFRISGEPLLDETGKFTGYRGLGTEYKVLLSAVG